MKNKNSWCHPSVLLDWCRGKLGKYIEYIAVKCSIKRNPKINHDVTPKQIINSESPAKEEQIKFIDEGGNSQPLEK